MIAFIENAELHTASVLFYLHKNIGISHDFVFFIKQYLIQHEYLFFIKLTHKKGPFMQPDKMD